MRTHPNRAGILRLRPIVVITATPVAKRSVTVGTCSRLPPMMFRLSQRLHQQLLQFVAIQKAELFPQKLLLRVRGKPFGQNHLASSPVALLNSICRLMHWYELKNPKSKPLPRNDRFRFGHSRFSTPDSGSSRGKKRPGPRTRFFFSRLWHGGTQLSAVSLPSSLRARKPGRRLVDRSGFWTGDTQLHSRVIISEIAIDPADADRECGNCRLQRQKGGSRIMGLLRSGRIGIR